eukprot:1473504-Rhodomonas_salina.1
MGTASCTVPARSVSGVVKVRVIEGDGGIALEGEQPYLYYQAPTVVGIQPSRGLIAGGTSVSVVGSGFVDGGLQCRFGVNEVVAGRSAEWISSTALACVAPVSVSGPGIVGVEVSVNDGADFTADGKQFLYEVGATVDALRPSYG